MSEICEEKSKSNVADTQNEKDSNLNGKMKKSRKRKRVSEPVRHLKKMRLEKEVRKRNSHCCLLSLRYEELLFIRITAYFT